MEQITQQQSGILQTKIEIYEEVTKEVGEEDLKKEILNYLLDEESGFEV